MKNVLSPARLLPLVWALCLLAYVASFAELPTLRVIIWVVLAVTAFSAGAALRLMEFRSRRTNSCDVLPLGIICLLLLPFQLYYLYECVLLALSQGSIEAYLVSVRQAALSGDPLIENYNFFLQINATIYILASFGLARIFVLERRALETGDLRKYKAFFYLIFVMNMIAAIIDGSRSFLMVSLLSLAALHLAADRLRLETLLLVGGIVLAIFFATFSLFRPLGDDADSLQIARQAIAYVCGSLGSMDMVLRDATTIYWQDLESISNKLNALGLPLAAYDLQSLKSEYAELPFDIQINVYSAFALYYQYMGAIGGTVLLFVIGVGSGAAYKNRLKSAFSLTVYSMFWPAIILTPFHDYFVQQCYASLKLAIYAALLGLIYEVAGLFPGNQISQQRQYSLIE